MFFTESTGFQESGKYNYIVIDEHTDLGQLAEDSILEAEEYTARLMEGIGRFELAKISEGVAPTEIYTEGMVGAIWEKIKKIFKFAKEWIKTIFRKFMAWINSIIKSDESFATKYKSDIEKGFSLVDSEKEFDIKIKKDLIKESGGGITKVGNYATEMRTKARVHLENVFSGTNGDALTANEANGKEKDGKTSKVAHTDVIDSEFENFKDTLEDKFTEFKEELYDKDKVKVSDFSSAKNIIDILKLKTNTISSEEKKIVSELEKTEKQFKGYDTHPKTVAAINVYIGYVKRCTNEFLSFIRTLKSAARKAARLCISAANKGPKWSEYRESAFDRTDLDSYLRNI